MLKIDREIKNNKLTLRISGSLEENVNFDKLILDIPDNSELDIFCKDVNRINSVGVKAWIKYFQSLNARKIKFNFFDCSVQIVEQINLISNFVCGGQVQSICIPYVCTACKIELIVLFKVSDLKQLKMLPPEVKCNKCGKNAFFDDFPKEYLGFLSR